MTAPRRSIRRRQGVGQLLFDRVFQTAKSWRGLRQINLGVVTTNIPALGLYRDAGFVTYGCEKDALQVGGKYYDEELMMLRLP